MSEFASHERTSPCCSPVRADPSPRRAQGPASTDSSGAGADRPGPVFPESAFTEIPEGTFRMGTDDPAGYPADGEGPEHDVRLSGYRIGTTTVTNAEFAAFVEATDHRTTAEELESSFVFGGLLPDDFPPTQGVAAAPWWRLVEGADWMNPEGPGSDLDGRGDHPVVHVSWSDASRFATWAGARLPTEAEWERAARGGLDAHHFPWGDELEPDGTHRMNVFQGTFPGRNLGSDGWIGTCPVRSYPANGFGLFEMTGNVWEWCADWFDPTYYQRSPGTDPEGPTSGESRVMRGGSYLCHDSYCRRYRVDARSANATDSTAGNIGFRIAV